MAIDEEVIRRKLSNISDEIRGTDFEGFQFDNYSDHCILKMKVGGKVVTFDLILKTMVKQYDNPFDVDIYNRKEEEWL